mgnify:CR=1 FL=1
MRLIIVSGLSGSGKSIALETLEDCGYYCIDNLPVKLLAGACDLTTSFAAATVFEVTASYAGDENHLASDSLVKTVTVTLKDVL